MCGSAAEHMCERALGAACEGFMAGGSPPDSLSAKQPASAAEGRSFVERACFCRREPLLR
jgi:hypothetical protein